MAFCASCGKQLADDARFCDGCGASMGAQPPQVAAPQAQQPPVQYAPPQPQYPAAPAPSPASRLGKGPFIAIIAVVLVAVLGAGAWWYLSNRPMSEAEYEKAAEEILTDFGKAIGGMGAMDTEDFETGQKAVKDSADAMQDVVRRAKKLTPPEAYEGAHDDLVDALEGFADFIGRMNEIAQKASSNDEASAMLETEFSDAEGLAFFSSFAKLGSVMAELGLDPVDVLGEEFADLALTSGELGDYSESDFEGAKASAEEHSCFANQRTIEGAAQVYIADDLANSLSDLDGSDWEYLLVPDFIKETPYCPTDYDSYYLYDGEVEPCPVHGHF